MSKIRILPEILSNKIAAGEVVERPASVVKELVENAIDADSTRIMVEIEQGGRKLIRVSDNGQGMNRDDALLCLERYATSKIAGDPDLFAIRTMGFRGEALPSIASVSRFTLITREAGDDVGTRIEVAGGRITDVMDVGAPIGTMITVAGLFHNTPARRKFLKSIDTEKGHIADTIASMALCRPAIQFRLSHNQRIVKNWSPAVDPTDRVADVLGAAVKKELRAVDHIDGEIEISGWVAAPRMSRSTSRGVYLFVNRRWVKDRVVQHALMTGYAGRLMKGQYPVSVLFVNLPFDQVDVNVHPAKNEIRFVHQKRVYDGVRKAVAEALKQFDPPRWNAPARRRDQALHPTAGVSETAAGYGEPASPENGRRELDLKQMPGAPSPQAAHSPTADDEAISRPAAARPSPSSHQDSLWKPRFFADLTLIGQYKGTYIICESQEGLMLIDQHAAHERIVFEQLKQMAGQRRPASQRLLLTETIDLGFREAQILERLAPELDRYGLEIEPFGGTTFVVKAMPTLLDSSDISNLVYRLVEKTAQIDAGTGMESILDECLMVMACHHAIRAHQELTRAQIEAMLQGLDACDNPSHCPHGRPIWIRWSVKDLEKQFQRII